MGSDGARFRTTAGALRRLDPHSAHRTQRDDARWKHRPAWAAQRPSALASSLSPCARHQNWMRPQMGRKRAVGPPFWGLSTAQQPHTAAKQHYTHQRYAGTQRSNGRAGCAPVRDCRALRRPAHQVSLTSTHALLDPATCIRATGMLWSTTL